jgi:hypothetical protein
MTSLLLFVAGFLIVASAFCRIYSRRFTRKHGPWIMRPPDDL